MTEETIFLAALDKKDPTERAAYLDAACAGQPHLRQQVEALLRSHADPDSFLDVPAAVRHVQAEETAQTVTSSPVAANGSKDADLAILGPAREPGALGSLDHYEVLEKVGRGAMGVVYKAYEHNLKRVVAIKILAAHLAADGTARKRFVREAQAAAAIRDPHVVTIHAVSENGSVPYLVMEFIGGRTLEQQIKAEGPPTVKEILRIGMQAAEGLAAAHRQGLIHRDVKPANILLENGVQRVKLVDFGLARISDNANLTQPGMVAGTPSYMSPEQTRGEALDHRSDLFSLGSVLYFVCTGGKAFAAANVMAVIERVRADTPRPIRGLNSEIPDWLVAVVDKLMAKDPKDRFQTAAEVAALLGDHLARLQQSGPLPAPLAMPAKPEPPRRGKRKWIALAAAGILAASVLTLGIYLASVNPPDEGRIPTAPLLPPLKPDPKVLTVSQKPADGGRFRTIGEALAKVEPGMIIRVLDDAIYEEQIKINRPNQYRGLVLEAAGGKKPILRLPKDLHLVPPHSYCIGIIGVAHVTLRGFQIDAAKVELVFVTGISPGIVLENLDFVGDQNEVCVTIYDLPLSAEDPPLRIQNCVLRNKSGAGICVIARKNVARFDQPWPCANVVIYNNDFSNLPVGAIVLMGAPQRILVVGNRIVDCNIGIDLREFLPRAANVLVANNTLHGNLRPLLVWDEKDAGLQCKNIRFQNNLVLSPGRKADLFFFDHQRGVFKDHEIKRGDIPGLLKAWRFSHNWREISPPPADDPDARFWIPGPKDTLQKPIEILSRIEGKPNFLRPPKNSPLAEAGAGLSDKALPLPSYVGAVPPVGVKEWDWSETWKALAR